MTETPIVTTERLRLRLFSAADGSFLQSMMADPAVTQFLPGGPYDAARTRQWLAKRETQWAEYGRTLYAVETRTDGNLVGYCGFIAWQLDGCLETEIAYGLAPTAWGHGYALEAARGCRDLAFGRLGLARLIALIHPENLPSRKVAQGLGMTCERTIVVKGIAVDQFVLRHP